MWNVITMVIIDTDNTFFIHENTGIEHSVDWVRRIVIHNDMVIASLAVQTVNVQPNARRGIKDADKIRTKHEIDALLIHTGIPSVLHPFYGFQEYKSSHLQCNMRTCWGYP